MKNFLPANPGLYMFLVQTLIDSIRVQGREGTRSAWDSVDVPCPLLTVC